MAINIENQAELNVIPPLWRMPFRPFFSGMAFFSCIAALLWVVNFTQGVSLGGVNFVWHMHEMIIGFAATTVVGFVLTASQTWTGVSTLRGKPLATLFLIWVSARVMWLLPFPYGLIASLWDALFFIIAAIAFGRQIILAKNWRNAFFIAIFLALSLGSLFYGYALWKNEQALAKDLLMGAFFLIIHVVLVVGGRVIPFFTDRGLKRPATEKPLWLELCALIASLVFLGVYFTHNTEWLRSAAGAVVVFHCWRWIKWKPWETKGVPILWSLHVAYFCVILGFVFLLFDLPYSSAIHVLAIGGFGLMILAMISRVSLGHSGRPLILPNGFKWAYVAIIAAVICRACANLVMGWYLELLWLTALLWILGFGMFLFYYFPILSTPRADGKPG